jgi:hypothetical protein
LDMRGKEGDGQKEEFLAMWFGSSRFHGVVLVFLRNVFAIVPMTTTIKSSGGNASSQQGHVFAIVPLSKKSTVIAVRRHFSKQSIVPILLEFSVERPPHVPMSS